MTGYRVPRAIIYTPPRNREQRLTDIATITNNLLVNRMLGTPVGPGRLPQMYRPTLRDLIDLLPIRCPDCTLLWDWRDLATPNNSQIVNGNEILAEMRETPLDEFIDLEVVVDCARCGITHPKNIQYIAKLKDAP